MSRTEKPDQAAPKPHDKRLGSDSWFGDSRAHASHTVSGDTQAFDAASPAPTAPHKSSKPSTFLRVYRAFLTARAALALFLISLTIGAWLLGNHLSAWVLGLTLSYSVLSITMWVLPSQRNPKDPEQRSLKHRQSLATIGLDLTAFAWLNFLTGSSLNSQALLALPVLMAAILMPRIMSLGVAAAATLNMLAAAWLQSSENGSLSSLMTQAGLTGFGLFAIAIMASELASRLAREERSAQGSLDLARQQAQLNRLVIEEMAEGVMVIDRTGRVRTANPAARRLLVSQGSTQTAPFQLRGISTWAPLIKAIEQSFANPRKAEEGQDLTLLFEDHSSRALRMRVRFTQGRDGQAMEDVCVIFLEDLRTVMARHRQSKLAAMGRMSAGIAHEIRNPLSAIAQANALLAEDASTPTQKRLAQMVADNVARLKHIVDDVLTVAPGLRPPAPAIDLREQLTSICQEWRHAQAQPEGPQSILTMDLSQWPCEADNGFSPKIRFEPDHLQRVLINLLDNALRHGSHQPGAIALQLSWNNSRDAALLSIASDGSPIPPNTEQSLFEPFFSTRSQGTGLGLYICKELCERHGASIDYRQHPSDQRHRNEFFVTLPCEPTTPA